MITNMITIDEDQAEALVAFIKSHEREDIPDEVWEMCMNLWDYLYN